MNKIDLLIAGAGPVGLTLAVECLRYGIPFRIVEKAPQASDKSKALAIWSGTQEALAAMGLVDVFLNEGIKVRGIRMCDEGRTLATNENIAEGVSSLYPRPIIVPQSKTEQLLAGHLAKNGCQVERQTELVSLTDKPDGVECHLRKADGSEEVVFARYLAGCDGARSVARHAFDVEFPGVTEAVNFLLIDCAIDGGDLRDDEIVVSWGKDGGIAFFPVVKGVYRIFAQRKTDDTSEPTLEEMQRAVDKYYPVNGMKLRDPSWLSFFRINERVAAQFCLGRVFLLGDAAHIHSPAGGQGMNTGMQDATNLAWKLALLLKGIGDAQRISRSYQAERHPVAKAVVKGATDKLRMGMADGAIIRALKDFAIPVLFHIPAFRQYMAHDLSELSIHYKESPLLDVSAPWPSAKTGFLPGTRPRDAAVQNAKGETVSLWETFLRPRHTLLIFSGENPEPAILDTVKSLQTAATEAKDEVDILLVWQGDAPPSVSYECLLDPAGDAHRLYGARGVSWYLIRPDQYAACRCQPAETVPLQEYIRRALK